MTNTEQLAHFVAGLSYADLPRPVVAKAKRLVQDAVGVQLAASTLPWSKSVYRHAMTTGGAPHSTVVNYGTRTSSAEAAFVNSAFTHGFEMDDNHARTSLKGSSVAVPTVLAVGERELRTGQEVLTAMVAGYELMVRIVQAAAPNMWARGNHPTGNSGAIGAAAMAGKLLGLDERTLVHALGVGANQLFGYSEVPATGRGHVKRIFGALAAAGGIRAAELAAWGMTAPSTSLDADSGFCRVHGVDDAAAARITDGLGEVWEILNVHHKVYAQDGYLQPVTEALERIRAAHDFSVRDIEEVWVGTNSRARYELVGLIREPRTLTDAQFSGTFSVALYLVKGGAGFHEYTEANLHDPDVLELSQRVTLEVDEEIEREFERIRPRGAKVAVRLKSGEEFREHVPNLREMTSEDLDDKFRRLAGVVLDEEGTQRLLDAVHAFEGVRDVSAVMPLLSR